MSLLRKLSNIRGDKPPKRQSKVDVGDKDSFQSNSAAPKGELSSKTDDATTNGHTRRTTTVEPIPEAEEKHGGLDILAVLQKQLKDGFNTSTPAALIDALRHKEGIDDRKLLLEHSLSFMSRLPSGCSLSIELQNRIISLLYNDLSHPAPTYLGNEYKYRSADGSNNNILAPDMGKAGMPYSRSVQQVQPLSTQDLPDAGLVFDTLLQRDKFKKHPGGLSSLMFAFAALVIHTVFRTSHTNANINETSSYVDLAPLYGNNQAAQDKVRKRDGYGLLHNDTFAENRLLLLPPAVGVLLILFCRNHIYIAKKLFEINERGSFLDPATLSSELVAKQDEEIFQTARLVNCGWFGTVIFSDYFSSILGLVRQGNSWSLNPFGDFRRPDDHANFERGQGNVVSVEFNCLYRWHATTSQKDEKWVEELMGDIFKGKPLSELTARDFKAVGQKLHSMDQEFFAHLNRKSDGTFNDEDLAKILHEATEEPAAAFGARGTPVSMRLHEVMGIEQNRHWGICSLNEFRKFLGLKTYEKFSDWNSDPDVANAAEKLYGHIDNLELYVGLQAEDAKPLVEGAGLCPGYTISRAILSDAIALTRGDRFFTQDYTPANLTTWGFADCQRDPDAFGFGSALGKLFLRTLPEEFGEDGNSVYAFFPLMTPDSMKQHLEEMDLVEKYNFARPKKEVLLNGAVAHERHKKRAAGVLDRQGRGFYPTDNDDKRRDTVVGALVKLIGSEARVGEYFCTHTQALIKKQSFPTVDGKHQVVDIVRDVFKTLTMIWAADVGGISLKTKETPRGSYTPMELFDILGNLYEYIFLHVDQARLMVLKDKVSADVHRLSEQIKSSTGNSWFPAPISLFGRKENDDVDEKLFVKRLIELGVPADETVNSVLAVMIGASVELSLAMAEALDWAFEKNLTFGKGEPADHLVAEALRGGKEKSPLASGVGVARCLGDPLTVQILADTLRAVFSFPDISRGPGTSGTLKRFAVDDRQRHGYLDGARKITPWPTSLIVKYQSASRS